MRNSKKPHAVCFLRKACRARTPAKAMQAIIEGELHDSTRRKENIPEKQMEEFAHKLFTSYRQQKDDQNRVIYLPKALL
jgi:hypothetical protein